MGTRRDPRCTTHSSKALTSIWDRSGERDQDSEQKHPFMSMDSIQTPLTRAAC